MKQVVELQRDCYFVKLWKCATYPTPEWETSQLLFWVKLLSGVLSVI